MGYRPLGQRHRRLDQGAAGVGQLVFDPGGTSACFGYLPFPLTLAQAARRRLAEATLPSWDGRPAPEHTPAGITSTGPLPPELIRVLFPGS